MSECVCVCGGGGTVTPLPHSHSSQRSEVKLVEKKEAFIQSEHSMPGLDSWTGAGGAGGLGGL